MPQNRRATVRNGRLIWPVVAVLAVAGCSGDDPEPAPAATTTPPLVATSALPTTSAGGYNATRLKLCDDTDLSPVKGLGLTKEKADPKTPPSAPGAGCLFDLKTRDGHDASLLVEASTLESAEQATQLYKAKSSNTNLVDEGPVVGLGDEAEGFAGQSTASGERTAEYLVQTHTANLVVKVFLTVGGDDYATKASLAGPAHDIAAATVQLAT
jgi:hypothetical protein